MNSNSRCIAVFTGDPSYSVTHAVFKIDQAMPGLEWLIVHHAPPKTWPRVWGNQILNFKRNGWRWIPYQLWEIVQLGLKLLRSGQLSGNAFVANPSVGPQRFDLAALKGLPNVRLERVADIHGEDALRLVRDFAPDLGLSLAAPILKRPLFSIPRLGTVNLHKGKLPDFRGMPPAFWELWHDQASVGCSVHMVDDKLDTGAVLARDSVDRSRYSTLRGLQLQLDEVGNRLLTQAVPALLRGQAEAAPQPAGVGKTFRKPTLAQIAALKRKMAFASPGLSGLSQSLKGAVLTAGVKAHRSVGWRWLDARVTVVLYHRVSDEVRDNLTVGVEQFERQMALLRRDCDLLSIEQVLALADSKQPLPKSRRPKVAVTFDDGYLDNYALAVPSLLRHAVPAAFFVSTGLMGTEGRFPHDVRRQNPQIPLMNWDHLREMVAWGFTIGSHSVNHIDCAGESEALVREELVASRRHLQQELGLKEVIFAYPYGGRQHMSPQRLQLVKEAGYSGCLSAYGGSNVGGVDRFNVLRKGVNHEFNERAFAWECLGLR
jgi:peptidoglycan/xylan/chitin deacetylase (PgdA/CDA1 family)